MLGEKTQQWYQTQQWYHASRLSQLPVPIPYITTVAFPDVHLSIMKWGYHWSMQTPAQRNDGDLKSDLRRV